MGAKSGDEVKLLRRAELKYCEQVYMSVLMVTRGYAEGGTALLCSVLCSTGQHIV